MHAPKAKSIHTYWFIALLIVLLGITSDNALAQDRFEGSALIVVEDAEYLVAIECDDAARPELGFSTEPNRITRERTGRTNGVTIRLRQWEDSEDIVVSLDRYMAWMPRPSSASGTLSMTLDLSPISVEKDGQPALLTREMWDEGFRPEGISGVKLDAQCNQRDPEAPWYRKISN